MTRRWLFSLLPAVLGAQSRKKFYIFIQGSQCVINPVESYGTDALDALHNCCARGGVLVWTEADWLTWQAQNGKRQKADCEALEKRRSSK